MQKGGGEYTYEGFRKASGRTYFEETVGSDKAAVGIV